MNLPPFLDAGEQVLATVLEPLDRAAQPERQVGHQEVFRVERLLDAERAAHVRCDHAHLLLRQIE